DGGRGPRLRGTRNRVKRRALTWVPGETAEQLRQPVQIEVLTRREQAVKDGKRRGVHPVAAQAGRDESIIVRPDRTIVVRHRVVPRFGSRDRANAPTGE